MTQPTKKQLIGGLRAWIADHDLDVRAAVELLIEHDHWLRNGHFVRACVHRSAGGFYWIDWEQARAAYAAGLGGSSTQLAVLDFAVALGCDRYRFNAMGQANSLLRVSVPARAVAEEIIADGAVGALHYWLRQHCQDTGLSPGQALRAVSGQDRVFCARAELPAAFLASRIRDGAR